MDGGSAVVDVAISELRFMLKQTPITLHSHPLSKHQNFCLSLRGKFRQRTVMDAISIVPNLRPPTGRNSILPTERSKSVYHVNGHRFTSRRNRISAVDEVSAVTFDQASPEITWQIIVGSIAGVTPFVVAGIEFSKRIVAQKKCIECGGSGLVLMEKEYIRCPNCGGFLPWQSWKRFFSG